MNIEDLLPRLLLPVSQSQQQSLSTVGMECAGSIDHDYGSMSISLAVSNTSIEFKTHYHARAPSDG